MLKKKFFARSTAAVAQALLGKFLVRRNSKNIAMMVTEVEVYDGFNDKASHASRGRTERNKLMFGEAGVFYVYFTYGMHWLLNVVTGAEGYPAAILIRGGVTSGEAGVRLDGPAKLTKFLSIDGKFNNRLASKKTGLWFEDRGVRVSKAQIARRRRVGVDYAGSYWAGRRRRFLLKTEK